MARQQLVSGLETDQFGYLALQATRPQTIGYPFGDLPAGQAAWIYEKFHAWTNNKGNAKAALTPDQMLDNITYWLTDTAASSAHIYAEHAEIGAVRSKVGSSTIACHQMNGSAISPKWCSLVDRPRLLKGM